MKLSTAMGRIVAGYNRKVANSVKWTKLNNCHYTATIDGRSVKINRYTFGIQIDGGEWQRQKKCTLSELKAKAVRLAAGPEG